MITSVHFLSRVLQQQCQCIQSKIAHPYHEQHGIALDDNRHNVLFHSHCRQEHCQRLHMLHNLTSCRNCFHIDTMVFPLNNHHILTAAPFDCNCRSFPSSHKTIHQHTVRTPSVACNPCKMSLHIFHIPVSEYICHSRFYHKDSIGRSKHHHCILHKSSSCINST